MSVAHAWRLRANYAIRIAQSGMTTMKVWRSPHGTKKG